MSLVTPKMWDDKHFLSMSSEGKLLWLYLLTGVSGGVPGLIKGGVGAYADALHWDYPVAEAAMRELVNTSMIQFDNEARMICIPNAPKYSPCSNANVIKGWYRRWGDLAESPLKYSHIESIWEAFNDKDWFADVWEVTFGQVRIPEPSKQLLLLQQPSSIGSATGNGNNYGTNETNREPFGNGIANGSANKAVADITTNRNRNLKPQTETTDHNLPLEALDLAHLLARAIAARQPKSAVAQSPSSHADRWASDIDKLHRLNGRGWDEIRAVLEWSQNNSFWQKNIRSGSKLRKQFDQLEAGMLADSGNSGSKGGYVTSGDMDGLIALAEERDKANEGT